MADPEDQIPPEEEEPEIYPWAEKVRSLQKLDQTIPDERIEKLAEISADYAEKYLGEDNYAELSTDRRLEYAICALTISKVITSSREINESSSIHRTTGFGEGEIYPSEISEMLNLAKYWQNEAEKTLAELRREIKSEFGWIDI